MRSRSTRLAATPPPTTMVRAPCRSAARRVLVASTSTTDSWNAHASSATAPPGARAVRLVGSPLARHRCPQLVRDRAPHRGLEAAEAEVVRVAQPRAREPPVVARGADRGGHDGRPAGIRQARAAGRPCRRPRPPRRPRSARAAGSSGGRVMLDQERVAAADHERHERERGRRPLRLVGVQQPRGVDVALEVVHGHERQPDGPTRASGPS